MRWIFSSVLIVAKCIVNNRDFELFETSELSINSSKVYCKSIKYKKSGLELFVLIVAKCIVNVARSSASAHHSEELIVAKCIVNLQSTTTKNKYN